MPFVDIDEDLAWELRKKLNDYTSPISNLVEKVYGDYMNDDGEAPIVMPTTRTPKKKKVDHGINPNISDLECIEIALKYLQEKTYFKFDLLALLIIQEKAETRYKYIRKQDISSELRNQCSRIVRKMKNVGALKNYNRRVYMKTDIIDTISATDIFLTSVNPTKKPK